jgi:hypothetical protein
MMIPIKSQNRLSAVRFADKADAIFNKLNPLALKYVENAVNRHRVARRNVPAGRRARLQRYAASIDCAPSSFAAVRYARN